MSNLDREGNAIVLTNANREIVSILFDRDVAEDANLVAKIKRDKNQRHFHRHRAYVLLKRGILDWADNATKEAGCFAHIYYMPKKPPKVHNWIYYSEDPNPQDCRKAVEDWIIADCGSAHYEKVVLELEKETLKGINTYVHLGRTLQMAHASKYDKRIEKETRDEENKEFESQWIESIAEKVS